MCVLWFLSLLYFFTSSILFSFLYLEMCTINVIVHVVLQENMVLGIHLNKLILGFLLYGDMVIDISVHCLFQIRRCSHALSYINNLVG